MLSNKRLLCLMLVLMIALSMTACNNAPQPAATEPTIEETQEPADTTDAEQVDEPPQISFDGAGIELTYLGRASVRLDLADGRTIYIDPAYGSKDDYANEADLVLVTHQHSDHNKINRVTLKEDGKRIMCPDNIQSGGVLYAGDIKIQAVDAYNKNHDPAKCCGFIITIGDVIIYHSGDTSKTTQMNTFSEYNIDYALLCMDGYYNMGYEEAMEVADIIDAQAVIPIHTSPDTSYDIETAKMFDSDTRIIVDVGETLTLYDLTATDGVHIPFDMEIISIMRDRQTALDTKDYDLYMSDIGQNNQFYFNEQERWFEHMIDETISDISFEIVSVETIDAKTGVVNLIQRHTMDKDYELNYPLVFKYENGDWKDYGYHFEIIQRGRFIVMYMKGDNRAYEFAAMLDDAFDNLDALYELKPVTDYEMKLFSDQEMLRQRTIPSNTWLFTGWSEPDESLKMYTGYPREYKGYPGVVQHELVHHITIRMCNNNLPVWLLEGIAMYDGSAHYGFAVSGTLSHMTEEGIRQTIEQLEAFDTASTTDRQDVVDFYTASYMYVRYIDETYGRDKLMAIFTEAGKKPFHDSTLNEMFETNNQKTADEVIMTVLGLTKAELSEMYLMWLDSLVFEEIAH